MSDDSRLNDETIEKIKETLENTHYLYPLEDANARESCLYYRSHLSEIEYRLWLESGIFEVSYKEGNGTHFSDEGAINHLETINVLDEQYFTQLIINYSRLPESEVFSQKEIDDFLELLNSCEHLGSFEQYDNIACFYPIDKNLVYRVYKAERQIVLILGNNDWMTVDRNDFQKAIKTIKVNEHRFQKALEEAGVSNSNIQKLL